MTLTQRITKVIEQRKIVQRRYLREQAKKQEGVQSRPSGPAKVIHWQDIKRG